MERGKGRGKGQKTLTAVQMAVLFLNEDIFIGSWIIHWQAADRY